MKVSTCEKTSPLSRKVGVRNLAPIAKAATSAGLCLLLVACAGGEVKPEDRDRSGTFDGAYAGQIAATSAEYRVQNWRITCWDMAGKMNVRVKDGTAKISWANRSWTTPVGKDGGFKLIAPSGGEAKNKTSNSSSLRKEMNFVVEGDLRGNKLSGRLTHGFQEFANQGCNSKVSFNKST